MLNHICDCSGGMLLTSAGLMLWCWKSCTANIVRPRRNITELRRILQGLIDGFSRASDSQLPYLLRQNQNIRCKSFFKPVALFQ